MLFSSPGKHWKCLLPPPNFWAWTIKLFTDYKSFFDLDDSLRFLTSPSPSGLNDRGHHFPDELSILILVPTAPNLILSSEWLYHPSNHLFKTETWTSFLSSSFPHPSLSIHKSCDFLPPKSHLNVYTSLHPHIYHCSQAVIIRHWNYSKDLHVFLPQSLSKHSLDNAGWMIFVKAWI